MPKTKKKWVKLPKVRVRERIEEPYAIEVEIGGALLVFASGQEARQALRAALILCGGQ